MTATPRRIVDSHLHIWPEPIPGLAPPWPEQPNPHTVEQLLPVMDDAGVAAAVQVTPSTLGYDNDYGLACADRLPARLAVFGRLDPDLPDPHARLSAWIEHPAALGVRFMFHGGPAIVADHPFLAAAAELGIPVAVYAPGAVRRLVEIATRYPHLHLVVDHLGLDVYGPEPFADQPLLAELVPFERVRVKISGLVETSREPFPFRDVHDHLARALELFGASRLIWGSNYPVSLSSCGSYRETLDVLDHCGFLSEADLDAILAGTFDALVEETL